MVTPRLRRHRRIVDATRAALHLMPPDGSFEGLLQHLATQRGRVVTVVEHDLRDTGLPSGLWVAGKDCDLIVVEAEAGPSRRAVIVAHEVAHMILGHDGDLATDLVLQAVPDLRPALVGRVLHRDCYETTEENDAEEVATHIVVESGRRRRDAELRANRTSARLR